MLHEAELFVMAEQMLVEVLGRIRPEDRAILLPPMFPGADQPATMRSAVEDHLCADALVPGRLLGEALHEPEHPRADQVARTAQAACEAARQVADGNARVSTELGEVTAREALLRWTVERSLLAHYVAAYLGSTACPLPEELAQPLWTLTAPDAAAWRRLGHFREPMPLPENVSWRDRFLLDAGHSPHPLGHSSSAPVLTAGIT